MKERTIVCEKCGLKVTTKDPRKRYCTKRCADRSRNRGPSLTVPAAVDATDLKRFYKLDIPTRIEVLQGKYGHKIVGFDIEATHLKANVGRILCCSFKPLGGEVYTFSGLDRQFHRPDNNDDSLLAAAIRDELEKYDVIVGWNSKQFDVKFVNARNLHADQRTKDAQYHVDGMWSWRSKAAAWSGLDAVQKFVGPGSEGKTPIAWEQWMRAIGWNKELREVAMAEIIQHCERDVEVLEMVYLLEVRNNVVRSIRKDGGVL